MRCGTAAVIVAVSIVTAGTAAAQSRDDINWALCKNGRIEACTAIIQGGHETTEGLVAAFIYRGDAYSVCAPSTAGCPATMSARYDLAIQDYDQAIKLGPNNRTAGPAAAGATPPTAFFAFFHRGQAKYFNGEYDLAIQDYDQAIGIFSDSSALFLNRGNAYAGKGEYDLAIQDYDQAIKLAPNYFVAFLERGKAYASKGEYDLAIQNFDQVIRLTTIHHMQSYLVDAFNRRGNAYARKGKYDRAIQDYDQAISLRPSNSSISVRPSNSDLLGNRGLVYLMLKKLDLALADYSAAVEANPKNAFALYGRGMVKQLKGDTAGGNADIAAATQIDPDIAKDIAAATQIDPDIAKDKLLPNGGTAPVQNGDQRFLAVEGVAPAAAAGPTEDLISAATRGDAVAVEALLAKGADVNAKDNNGWSALMMASTGGNIPAFRAGCLDAVRALLAKGADVNAKDNGGATALMGTTDAGIRALLVQAGAKP